MGILKNLSSNDVDQIVEKIELSDLQEKIIKSLISEGENSPSRLMTSVQSDVSRVTFFTALSSLEQRGIIKKEGSAPSVLYGINEEILVEKYLDIDFIRRSPKIYTSDFFDNYIPNSSRIIPEYLAKSLRQASDAVIKNGDTINEQVFSNLLIDFSYASSHLEGNTYSLLDTKRLIEEGVKAEGKTEAESQMILNHLEAMRYLIGNAKDTDITPFEVRTVHGILSKGLMPSENQEGSIRKGIVSIGGSSYQPASGELFLSDQLEVFCKKASSISDPYECSVFILAGLSYLQAFNDVNKRTARLLSNLPLLKHNLCPVSFFSADNNSYIKGLIAFYELNHVGAINSFFSKAYEESALRYSHYLVIINHNIKRPEVVDQTEVLVRDYLIHVGSRGIYSGDPKSFIRKAFELYPNEYHDAVLASFVGKIKDLKTKDTYFIAKNYGIPHKQAIDFLRFGNDIEQDHVSLSQTKINVDELLTLIESFTSNDSIVSFAKEQLSAINRNVNNQITELAKQGNFGDEHTALCDLSNKIEKALSQDKSLEP